MIMTSSSDGSKRVHHTYVFPNREAKKAWINNLRYAKLKLSKLHHVMNLLVVNRADPMTIQGQSLSQLSHSSLIPISVAVPI